VNNDNKYSGFIKKLFIMSINKPPVNTFSSRLRHLHASGVCLGVWMIQTLTEDKLFPEQKLYPWNDI